MMTLETPSPLWKDYEIIDSGNGEKLERFGPWVLRRPEPKALWDKTLSEKEWQRLTHTHFRPGAGFGKAGKEDSGTWDMQKKMDEQWFIRYASGASSGAAAGTGAVGAGAGAAGSSSGASAPGPAFRLRLGLTSFKHVGVFPEQAPNWEYIYRNTRALVEKAAAQAAPGQAPVPVRVLNLFAYTGGATIAAAKAGAKVCHVDAAKNMVNQAKENAALNGLENAPIRYIVDDCSKFVAREIRRGNKYDAVIMDPPSYGRGPGGETWRLEDNIHGFISQVMQILSDDPLFILVNSYTTGLSAGTVGYLLAKETSKFGGKLSFDELGLKVGSTGGYLPCGASARWER